MLGDNLRKEKKDKLDELYLKMAEQIAAEFKDNIEDAETFNVLVNYQVEQISRVYAKKLLSHRIDEECMEDMLYIYINYSFIENSIKELIELKEADAEPFNKTRWVLNTYTSFIENRRMLDGIIPSTEDEYCIRPNFGTIPQWIEFCDSLKELKEGRPGKYLMALKKLVDCGETETGENIG